jgi:hypothetical protein
MLLIHPPLAKPCEPPAGIAALAAAVRGHGRPCTLVDANLEAMLHLLALPTLATDTWSKRAGRHLTANLTSLRGPELYQNPDRYQRAVADVNRLLELAGRDHHLALSLANYQDADLSPLRSADLLRAAAHPEANLFYPYFAARLPELLAETGAGLVGFSLNYLSQAQTTFAMVGFLKQIAPGLPVVLGGGLVTSWLRSPHWADPFAGLIDHLVAGPGEGPLLALLGCVDDGRHWTPEYSGLPLADYLAPGLILPYAASSGCYWKRCTFCPEKAEQNPYHPLPTATVLADLDQLIAQTSPRLIHFLDNAISPALMRGLIASPPGVPWYGFSRIAPELTEPQFCRDLKHSGCRMLKLGLESGAQGVLTATDKGIDCDLVSRVLTALEAAGIATFVYLLFGTPAESLVEARTTMEFVVRHHRAITFLNLAIFNMPIAGQDASTLTTNAFYEGALSLYTDFDHPLGWNRQAIRRFLDQEFKRHPAIDAILKRSPPLFTSNHAPFFC